MKPTLPASRVVFCTCIKKMTSNSVFKFIQISTFKIKWGPQIKINVQVVPQILYCDEVWEKTWHACTVTFLLFFGPMCLDLTLRVIVLLGCESSLSLFLHSFKDVPLHFCTHFTFSQALICLTLNSSVMWERVQQQISGLSTSGSQAFHVWCFSAQDLKFHIC